MFYKFMIPWLSFVRNRCFPRQKVVAFSIWLWYNLVRTQGSYIGNTTASQAVKAGSIPVPCSKSNSHPFGWLLLLEQEGIERPALPQVGQKVSGGHFLGRGRFHRVWSAGGTPVKQTLLFYSANPSDTLIESILSTLLRKKYLDFLPYPKYNSVRQI